MGVVFAENMGFRDGYLIKIMRVCLLSEGYYEGCLPNESRIVWSGVVVSDSIFNE